VLRRDTLRENMEVVCMSIFENFEKKLQAEPKSIVFTEGTDARILSAATPA